MERVGGCTIGGPWSGGHYAHFEGRRGLRGSAEHAHSLRVKQVVSMWRPPWRREGKMIAASRQLANMASQHRLRCSLELVAAETVISTRRLRWQLQRAMTQWFAAMHQFHSMVQRSFKW
eukprot:4990833-Pyramimonas_sp.AAC.1